jgi:hypothetical protein
MSRGLRILSLVIGIILLALGLGCLNYTKADGLQHHREVATRLGLPRPGEPILFGGAAALAIGGGLVGFALGRWSR